MNKEETAALVQAHVPSEWGHCMAGNQEMFLTLLAQGLLESKTHAYLEIGLACGRTFGTVTRFLEQLFKGQKGWGAVGLDIPGGWSLDEAQIRRHCPGIRRVEDPGPGLPPGVSYTLMPSVQYLERLSMGAFGFIFIDGCHGANCVRNDFFYASRRVKKGSIICFHDTSPNCQGHHHQPHCGTGIDARRALQELGLLENALAGWRLLCETPGDSAQGGHGCSFFVYEGIQG